jgi:O-antigen/teichoic acid export membrane protein
VTKQSESVAKESRSFGIPRRFANLVTEAKGIVEGPIVRNAASLYGATIVTSLLGFLYWLIAARMASAAAVGIAWAAQSAAQLLSLFCVLGLSTLLISELSSHREKARSIILTSAVITGACSIIVSAAVGIALAELSSTFRQGLAGSVGLPLFILLSAFTTTLFLLDDACIGLLRGDLQLKRNIVFAVSKLLILPPIILLWNDRSGKEIVAVWVAGLAISLLTLTRRLRNLTRGQSSRLDFRRVIEQRRLVVGHHSLNLSVDAPGLALPVIVVLILGAAKGAAFTSAWFMTGFVSVIPRHLSTVLFALAPGDEAALQREVRKTMRICLILSLAAIPFFVLFSGLILDIYGKGYEVAKVAMIILALTTYPGSIKTHYVAISRVRGRMQQAALYTLLGACIEVGLSAVGGEWWGLTGVAVGCLVAITIEAILFAPVVYGVLRRPHSEMNGTDAVLSPTVAAEAPGLASLVAPRTSGSGTAVAESPATPPPDVTIVGDAPNWRGDGKRTDALRYRQASRVVSITLLVVDLAVLVMTFGNVHGPVRFVLGLILGGIIPGWSIVGLLRLGNPALEFGLTVALSFTLLMLIAQVLETVHAWHLTGLQEVTCVACLPFLIWQILHARGPREHAQ